MGYDTQSEKGKKKEQNPVLMNSVIKSWLQFKQVFSWRISLYVFLQGAGDLMSDLISPRDFIYCSLYNHL